MNAFIIFLIIILIFAFFLNLKIRAEVSYIDGKPFFSVKYLFFTLYPLKEKENKIKKSKNTKTNKKKSSSESENIKFSDELISDASEQTDISEQKPKRSISEKITNVLNIIEKIQIIWSVSKKWLRHIFKHIYIEKLMIDFLIADEDPYKTALNYGRINAAVYNLINFIRTFFTVTIKTVDIACDFDAKEPVYDFSAVITVKPATILSAAFGILFGLLINIRKLIKKDSTEQSSVKKAVSM